MKGNLSWKIFPYALLILYVIFICYNFYNFANRLNNLLNHPVLVLQEARELKTRLSEMRNTLPGLMSNPDLTYEDILKVLQRQEEMQDESFGIIKEIYLGDPEHLDQLGAQFPLVRELRRKAARELLGNSDYNRAYHLYNTMIDPEVQVTDHIIDQIIESAETRLAAKKAQTESNALRNIIITIVSGLLLGLAFFAVNMQERTRTRQLRDRDRLFNQLSQNVDEIFIIAQDDHDFHYVTSNSRRLVDIDAKDILHNPQKLYDFLPPDDAAWLKDALSGKIPRAELEADGGNERLVVMQGGSRVFRIVIHPVDEHGWHRAIVTIQDRTKDFQQQQALSDALENAHASSTAKSNFLSHMSHEIRTPMNAIIGMTTIAISKIGNRERVEDCLGKIAESSRHLLSLINDVLDMSKIEHGKLSISHEPFNLAQTIRNLNDLVRPQAESRKLNFEIFQENVEEDNLIGDSLRLNQILLNILSNSLKFTPGGGTITLKIRQLTKQGSTVRLAFVISDTGIGMSKEYLSHLYTPFEQATATTTAKYGGTGLGMSITQNLISLMGGTISVESEEGVGTSFTVELPFGFDEHHGSKHETLPHLKVLVVDDDHGTCEHATLLLEKMGLQARWCTSGAEAVELVREAHDAANGFDVCFIDWKMPEMDGAETARRIREVAGDDVLIIIISAYDWTPIEEKAKQNGVNDFVAKPFFASTLHNVLLSTTRRYGVAGNGVADGSADAYDFSGRRILLVEDNEFNREIAQEFLDMVNATVENAENGQEAVDKFMASPPGYYDLILMDVQMPVMDGYDATKTIRASSHPDAADIHILAMTANAFSEDVAHAIASGMNGHIAKPVDVKELYRLINLHIGKRSAAGKAGR